MAVGWGKEEEAPRAGSALHAFRLVGTWCERMGKGVAKLQTRGGGKGCEVSVYSRM